MRGPLRLRVFVRFCAVLVMIASTSGASAVEVIRLSESTWADGVPEGKEVDCIYGDWVLRNDKLVAVIGDAIPTRNANMTVRNVGGAVIDLTVRDDESDQLSAYYPLGGLYQLSGPVKADDALDAATKTPVAAAALRFAGPATDKKSTAEVIYTPRRWQALAEDHDAR